MRPDSVPDLGTIQIIYLLTYLLSFIICCLFDERIWILIRLSLGHLLVQCDNFPVLEVAQLFPPTQKHYAIVKYATCGGSFVNYGNNVTLFFKMLFVMLVDWLVADVLMLSVFLMNKDVYSTKQGDLYFLLGIMSLAWSYASLTCNVERRYVNIFTLLTEYD